MFAISLVVSSLVLCAHSLPLIEVNNLSVPKSVIVDESYVNLFNNEIPSVSQAKVLTETVQVAEVPVFNDSSSTVSNETNDDVNTVVGLLTRNDPVRPGMSVVSYSVELTPAFDGSSFTGRATILVIIDDVNTREDPVVFNCEGLTINSVLFGIFTISNLQPAGFNLDDGMLEIFTDVESSQFFFVIEYQGLINRDGIGLYQGVYDSGLNTYLAMNLFPTNARRVFPCVDEPDSTAALSLSVNNAAYTGLVSNALNEGDVSTARFSPLSTATHLWGFVAHNFPNLNVPAENLRLYGRQGVGTAQTSYISIMIQSIFNQLNVYTEKNYFEIDANAEQYLHIFALPDITRDWKSLSTIGVWEPHMLMNEAHSIEQRKTALVATSNALSGQWFGYVIFPENWRYSWILKGLQAHVAFEVSDVADPELDMQAIFTADVMYETMYYDAYTETLPIEAVEDLYDETLIRTLMNGVMKGKAPAVMRMLKSVLSNDIDYIRRAAVSILNGRSLQSINSLQFQDSVNSEWLFSGEGIIDEVSEFLDPWIHNSGYPVITISTSTAVNVVVVTQDRFAYTNAPEVVYNIPLTYTTRFNPDFENINPTRILDSTGVSFGVTILDPEEDWIIFNIQGRGYYRVNYDFELWEKIIWSLEDPEQRAVIHPLNRAALVDDALNLARIDRLDYDIAFQVVLTMEHETSYPVWKAFIRNMEFLRKRLVALDDDWDDDIYTRMVRRSIAAVERDLGFSPDPALNEDPMVSMTRGMVMEHACKSLYQPCIAAAVDWFFDGMDINNNIPSDLRPAVYCTMVREGGADIRDLLMAKYETENSHWEKVVILKSLGCSQDRSYILSLLQQTITDTTLYGTQERSEIFKAIVESSADNTEVALNFLQSNINAIKATYGGIDIVEELLVVISENLPDEDKTNTFSNWANSFWVGDEEFANAARRAAAHALENLVWNNLFLESVYEWIDENDAPSLGVSLALVFCGVIINLINR